MRVALGLITCERFDYTKQTLATLKEHNPDLSRFELIHVDDASEDKRIGPRVRSYGFQTLRTTKREGVMSTHRLMAAEAERLGCDWTFILQNDWETARPFPWDLFEWCAGDPSVYCLRLFGKMKDRMPPSKHGRIGGRPAGDLHKGRDNAPANWRAYDGPEPSEIGSIHWGCPPSVTKTGLLTWLLDGATREADCRMKSGELDMMTVRPVVNVCWHIGMEITPGFRR